MESGSAARLRISPVIFKWILKMKNLSSQIDVVKADLVIFNREYHDFMKAAGFDSFEPIYSYHDGEVVKKIRDRSVIRIEIPNPGAGENQVKRFYLKKSNREYIGIRSIFKPLFPNRICSQGRLEFENIRVFRESDLATAAPVAAGQKFIRFLWAESFVITEDFFPFISLEDLLRETPEFFEGPDGTRKKKILIEKMGRLARKMHQSGLNHRDFNSNHILLRYDKKSDTPEIALFDLNRVNRRKFFRFRWVIKSLAELNYTLPDTLFSENDRIALFLSYKFKGNPPAPEQVKLNLWDRIQLFWIRRKAARIKRHTEKSNILKRLKV